MNFETWIKLFAIDILTTWIATTMLAIVERFSLLFNVLISIDVVMLAMMIFLFALMWTNRVD